MRSITFGIGVFACLVNVHAASAETREVNQVNQKFSETHLDLKAGEAVDFLNKDDVTHDINVINGDGDAQDQGLQKPGETIHFTFDKAGKFEVRCSIHPRMKLIANVQ